MTAVAWIAVCGPLVAGIVGFAVGLWQGVRVRGQEVGEMRYRLGELERAVSTARAQAEALAAAPLSRAQSGRVLDLVTPSAAH